MPIRGADSFCGFFSQMSGKLSAPFLLLLRIGSFSPGGGIRTSWNFIDFAGRGSLDSRGEKG